MINALQRSLCNPLCHILVPGLCMLNDVGVEDEEALPAQTSPDHLTVVLNPWNLGGGRIVCAYRAACHWKVALLALGHFI